MRRRIRNSVKAIIISICAVVVLLGAIVGVVLANRDHEKDDPNNKPQVPVISGNMAQLVSDINSLNKKPEINFYDEVPYTELDGCTYETIKAIGDNYIIYSTEKLVSSEDEAQDRFVVYKKLPDGSFEFRDLTNLENEAELSTPFAKYGNGFVKSGAVEYEIDNYQDDYVVIKCLMEEYDFEKDFEGEEEIEYPKYYYSLVYFGGDEPVEIFSFDTSDKSCFVMYNMRITEKFLFFEVGTYFDVDSNWYDKTAYIYELNLDGFDEKNDILYSSTVRVNPNEMPNYYIQIVDDYIFEDYGDKVRIGRYEVGNGLKFYEFDANKLGLNSEIYVNKISSTKFLIKEKMPLKKGDKVENSVKIQNEYFKFQYKILELVDGKWTQTDFNLSDGYSCADFYMISDDAKTFYAIEYKTGKNQELMEEYLVSYFDQNLNIILKYETKDLYENIVSADGTNFLTARRILTKGSSVTATSKMLFTDKNIELNLDTLDNNSVVYYSNGFYGVLGINGNILVDAEEYGFTEIYPSTDGYAIGVYKYYADEERLSDYYLINLQTGDVSDPIKNFHYDKNYFELIKNGVGLYFVDEENATLSLYQNGNLIYDNITGSNIGRYASDSTIIELYRYDSFVPTNCFVVDGFAIYYDDSYINSYNDIDDYYVLDDFDIVPYYQWTNQYYSVKFWDYNSNGIVAEASADSYTSSFGSTSKNNGYAKWSYYITVYEGFYITNAEYQTTISTGGSKDVYTTKIKTDADTSDNSKGTVVSNNGSTFTVTTDTTDVAGGSYKLKVSGNGYGATTTFRFVDNNSYSNSIFTCNAFKFKYSVDFIPNGGISGKYSRKTVNYGTNLWVKDPDLIPTKEGWSFTHWTEGNAEYEDYLGKITENHVLTAQWAKNKYKIWYSDVSGAKIGGIYFDEYNGLVYEVEYNQRFFVPDNLTRRGYAFKGWQIDYMSDDCIHYIGYGTTMETSYFCATGSRLEFMNLHSGGDWATVYFTAVWDPNEYTFEVQFTSSKNQSNYAGYIKPDEFTSDVLKNGPSVADISSVNNFSVKMPSGWTKGSSGDNVYYISNEKVRYNNTFSNMNVLEILNTSLKLDYKELEIVTSGKYMISGYAIHPNGNDWKFYTDDLRDTFRLWSFVDSVDESVRTIRVQVLYEQKDHYVGFFSNFAGGATKLNGAVSNLNTEGVYFDASEFIKNMTAGELNNPRFDEIFTNLNTSSALNNIFNYLVKQNLFYTDYGVSNSSLAVVNAGINHTINYVFAIDSNVSPYYEYKNIVLYNYPILYNGAYRLENIVCSIKNNVIEVKSYSGLDIASNRSTSVTFSSGGKNEITIAIDTQDNSRITIIAQNCEFGSSIIDGKYQISANTVNSSAGVYGFNVFVDVQAKNVGVDEISDVNNLGTSDVWYFTPIFIDSHGFGTSESSTYSAWIGGKRYSINKITNGLVNVDGHNAYVYKISSNEIYLFYRAEDFGEYINANNTELVVIKPQQSNIYGSSKPSSVKKLDNRYDLETYLSTIYVNGEEITLSLTRNLNDYSRYNFDIISGNGSLIENLTLTIPFFKTQNNGEYLGFYNYVCQTGFELAANGKTYRLFMSINSNSSYGNEILFFLMSDSNINEFSSSEQEGKYNSISFKYANFDNDIKFSVSDLADGEDYYDENDIGAQIEGHIYSANGERVFDVLNGNRLGSITGIDPRDTVILKIMPQDGYLIYSFKLTLGNNVLYQFKLRNLNLQLNSFGSKTYLSYVEYNASGSLTSTDSRILYNYEQFMNAGYSGFVDGADARFGIYMSDWQGNNWLNSFKNFESIYVMLAGIYEGVEIEIETISYTEFDFDVYVNGSSSININDFVIENSLGENIIDPYKSLYIGENLSTAIDANIISKINESAAAQKRFNRYVFLGMASALRGELKVYASSNDNSVELTNIEYYIGTSAHSYLSNVISRDGALNGNYIYFEISNIKDFFENSTTIENSENYILAKKYILAFKGSNFETGVTTNSYLFNNNLTGEYVDYVYRNKNYQLDDSSKYGSWFNDTILSNIYLNAYTKNGTLSRGFETNWQGYGDDSLYLSPIRNLFGYGTLFTYYEIPGYYLEYLIITFGDSSSPVAINLSTLMVGKRSQDGMVYATAGVHSSNGIEYYLKIVYHQTSSMGYYDIYLYNDETGLEATKDSLKTLQYSNISIDFLSMAYNINLYYNQMNGVRNYVSSYSEINNVYSSGYYDDINLRASADVSMKGYTLVGWGTSDYYDGNSVYDRFSNNASYGSVWNSSSSYINVGSSGDVNYFEPNNRAYLFAPTDNYYSYAFYAQGARFVTDTGYAVASEVTENYNFWLSYLDIFQETNHYQHINGIGHTFDIDLYAVWKANTYLVKLNFNDSNNSNGSTYAQLGLMNNILNISSLYTFDNNVGRTTFNVSYDSDVFYAYVTFDTNNWFITKTPAIAYSYYYGENNSNSQFSFTNENLLNYVIDRYGYTWLGWFDSKLVNVASNVQNIYSDSNYSSSAIFGSEYSPYTATLSGAVLDNGMPKLDINRLNRFLDNDANGESSDSASNTFYYYNAVSTSSNYDLPGSVRTGVYFYVYNNSSEDFNGYYVTRDYLNGYYNVHGVAYFDTMMAYDSYGTSGGRVTLNYSTGDYKYITLFANWQINRYLLKFDFADNMALDGYTRYGSSYVTNLDLSSLNNSEYYDFDSHELNDYLMKINPTRVGYDFVGWSFRYNSTPSSVSNGSIYNYANSYELNYSLLSYYTAFGNVLYLVNDDNQAVSSTYEYIRADVESNEGLVYLTAIWKTQEFKINVSIDADELRNALDKDSGFALGLYSYSILGGNRVTSYTDYLGINLSNLTYSNSDGSYNNNLVNITYTLSFDRPFSEAVVSFVIDDNTYEFYLSDLFVVSTGYEFLGFLFNTSDEDGYILTNSKNSMFNNNSNNFELISNNIDGTVEYYTYPNGEVIRLDYELYYRLSNTYYTSGGESSTITLSNSEGVLAQDSISLYEISSSSFGSISSNFIYCEDILLNNGVTNHLLYYKDANGVKNYLVLYVEAGGREIILENDHSSLKLYGNMVYVTDGRTYYVSSGNVVYINIFAKSINVNEPNFNLQSADSKQYIMANGTNCTFSAKSTREFTLYADWEIRDFDVNIESLNNSGTSASDNPGLAGYYEITSTSYDSSLTKTNFIESENDNTLRLQFTNYDKINIDILPYFNGRFLSEMTFTFYVIEQYQNSASDMFVNFTKTKYVMTFKFSWNNENLNIDLDSLNISSIGHNGAFDYRTSRDASGNIRILNATGNDDWGKLSLIDRDISSGILKIFEYLTAPSQTYAQNNRIDYNQISFDLQNVMTDIEITCKFSIQTFDVNVYNILDTETDNLVAINEKQYETPYSINTIGNAVSHNAPGNGGPYISRENAGKSNIATIPVDCAVENSNQYNVPYGYFIYGYDNYSSNINTNRPTAVESNINQKYAGYEYIFTKGYYYFGTNKNQKLVGSEQDPRDMQSTGILGDNVTFETSLRLLMTFYDFKGYYYASVDPANGRSIIFNDYAEEQDNYLNHNVEIYGYYYAINRATDVIFYVWDNSTMSYVPYSGNNSEYKSNYRAETSAFGSEYINGENIIVVSPDAVENIVDEENIAMLKYFVQFGVNATKFNNDDVFTLEDISREYSSNLTLLEYITKTYWIYTQNYYVYYYADEAGIKHYIYFDTNYNKNDPAMYHGFYITENGLKNGSRKYVELVSTYTSSGSQTIEGLMIKYDGNVIRLDYEVKYIYNLKGADLYAYMQNETGDPQIDGYDGYYKYYKIKELTEEALIELYGDASNIPEFVNRYSPRFYTQIEGETLFLLPHNYTANLDSFQFYRADGSRFYGAEITTINYYYINYNDEYYEVTYDVREDRGGSYFINPEILMNTVVINVNGFNQRYFFSYKDKLLYSNVTLTDRVRISYVSYSPVNENYTVIFGYNDVGRQWEIEGVSITKLLSPHVSAWLGSDRTDRYGFVGYIQIEDADFLTLLSDSGDTDSDHEQIYTVMKNRIISEKGADYAYFDELMAAIGEKIEEMTLANLLSSLLIVDQYNFDPLTGNLDSIRVRISITLYNVKWMEGDKEASGTFSSIVKYTFPLVKLGADVLTESVYAIPIYARNVVQFGTDSVKGSDNSTTVTVDKSKMIVNHFESESNSIHIYDESVGDYLQYVLLTSDEYTTLMSFNKDNLSDYINTILTELDGRIFEAKSDATSFTFNGDGTYYLIAIYYKYGTTGSSRLVNRVSDNCAVLKYGNGRVEFKGFESTITR